MHRLFRPHAALAAVALLAGGCTSQFQDLGREPTMSPVGYGLAVQPAAVYPLNTFSPSARKDYNSLWVGGREDFFSDPRARRVGDVLTVRIAINDKATLDNNSNRGRNSSIGLGGELSAGWDGRSTGGELSLDGTSGSNSTSRGSIDRKEEIELSVAAVVTDRLPNGNLVISGSQEVRVNYEMRVLNVAGIVRPRDIAGNNTIDYDKIAEARVSYGGRGRISEVQQPAWGQQLYDAVVPY
ncbi:flagellar basal body L-ring protein FlgH [Microvirga tunisiensis]|uniref:Flagellar basal body L-ring protein FlgH n=2 Tax=Pannonibacter tanglangensis TaxID=2750084 RepID=A0ABW9ZQ80_9HYPH|nr:MULTISPECIES: flagellar basal body L-ring protein FlgH [unclassified Pannonibacter]NBN64875.1 flagellar basal body L-ring protein FlgH [Pannonibacter sp. XCT-34]NBN79378.1 flagellar basal body L-ring protein FlgH [Pannonibacter sp. XCT-53]